ncbi:hypothetical protein ONA91_35855 [Micromonospora sp. DR5-3]|uniref:hypothetical protein n=1 Tax=unclassified Micromonospora TaxID=2617518 RepID=UPI0011D97A4D|nr:MULTISPECIES: hypothetical protein [unclassified Micromonospora]MCW3819825.1 hypothetical protein [Micromonospora sp. DR5-3]TYC20201.1 hypothetical protein FXF52_32575 [Micromonospora sp. MP36]
MDALTMKAREHGRAMTVHALIAQRTAPLANGDRVRSLDSASLAGRLMEEAILYPCEPEGAATDRRPPAGPAALRLSIVYQSQVDAARFSVVNKPSFLGDTPEDPRIGRQLRQKPGDHRTTFSDNMKGCRMRRGTWGWDTAARSASVG